MTPQDPLLATLWPYLVVVIIGFLPTEVWRVLGVLLSQGLDERSEMLVWVRAVATTLLAGVVAKLLFVPNGALAAMPLAGRIVSLGAGILSYFVFRRSVIAGVVTGEVVLIAVAWWATRPT
jgi:Branched-chain amino acid transport protein (AzlD)